jgi:hypothetical protein
MGPLPKLELVCMCVGGMAGGDLWGESKVKAQPSQCSRGLLPKSLRKAKAHMILLDIGTCKMS